MRVHIPSLFVVLLAFGAGLFFQFPEAKGLSGPSISYGSNPVVSFGGAINTNNSLSISAPQNSNLLITDVYLGNGNGDAIVHARLSNNTELGRWHVVGSAPIVQTMRSGILIPAGETLTLSSTTTYYTVTATLSGYYVQ